MHSKFKKVLVVGASGQLAQALIQAAPPHVECVAVSRNELDITDESAVDEMVQAVQPDCLFNGAAYNLVDKAETDGARDALEINALAVANLSKACRKGSTSLVHFSTDYVFDGKKVTPFTEEDATRPLGIYAASKLAGENIALAASEKNYAIRVCRLFGPTPIAGAGSLKKPAGNFPLLMLRLAGERDSLKVVGDQIGTPSYTPDLARGAWQLLEKSDGGLFHLSNSGEVSFADYAREVFKIAGAGCEVISISSDDYGAAARRPEYSVLSSGKAHGVGVEPLRDWKDALREFLENEL